MKKFLLVAVAFASALMIGLNVSGVTKAADDGYSPLFNQFTDVPGIGDEKDFLRVQNDDGTRVNTKEICSGTSKLWIYVHNNRPSQNNNDPNKAGDWDGVAVAKNTRVKLSLPGTFTNSTTATAKISADNAVNAPTDTAYFTCGSKKVKVEYVGVESVSSSDGQNSYTLTGDIMSANGASLNYKGNAGMVPGCWEYRASIVVKVKITEEPPVVKPQSLLCQATFDRKALTLNVKVSGKTTNGATVTGYRIVWGDGSADATTASATHTYNQYNKQYTATAYVKGTVDGKNVEVTDEKSCSYTFTEKSPEQPPVTPPEELPNTGAGSILGVAAVVAVLGTIAHRVWTVRRMQK